MTVCGYLSPYLINANAVLGSVVPIMFADTLSVHRSDLSNPLRPANVPLEDIGKLKQIKLVRKLNIHGNYALACSRLAQNIRSLWHELRVQGENWESDYDRPMSKLGEIAREINESYGINNGIEIIGTHISNGKINCISPHEMIDLTYFGKCAFMGSGQNEVENYIEQAYLRFCQMNNQNENATHYIIHMLQALNGQSWLKS